MNAPWCCHRGQQSTAQHRLRVAALHCCAALYCMEAPGNDGTNGGSMRQWEGADDENDDCNMDATMGRDTAGEDGSNGLNGR